MPSGRQRFPRKYCPIHPCSYGRELSHEFEADFVVEVKALASGPDGVAVFFEEASGEEDVERLCEVIADGAAEAAAVAVFGKARAQAEVLDEGLHADFRIAQHEGLDFFSRVLKVAAYAGMIAHAAWENEIAASLPPSLLRSYGGTSRDSLLAMTG